MQVAVDNFGRVLIPQRLRQHLSIYPGSTLELTENDERTIVLKVSNIQSPLKKKGKLLIYTGKMKTQDKNIVKLIRDDRESRNVHVI